MKSDSELEQEIRHALAERPDVYDGDIKVLVQEGVVTLSGKTRGALEKWQVGDLILAITGVVRLIDTTMIVAENASTDSAADIARPFTPS